MGTGVSFFFFHIIYFIIYYLGMFYTTKRHDRGEIEREWAQGDGTRVGARDADSDASRSLPLIDYLLVVYFNVYKSMIYIYVYYMTGCTSNLMCRFRKKLNLRLIIRG
jgi:hypothetical protein